jgi:hypothetical protein
MNSEIFAKACEQALCQSLGYDEGRTYYLILNKEEVLLKQDYSYSKRYRIMRSLFDLGVVGKLKNSKKDIFNYFLLPPVFLYSEKIDLEIIEYLEGVYLKNHADLFKNEFSQIVLKNEKNLLIFLLKYFMNHNARLVIDDLGSIDIIGAKENDIVIKKSCNCKRRMGIIDNEFVFEFVDVMNERGYESIGFLANNVQNGLKRDYVSFIDEEIRKVV